MGSAENDITLRFKEAPRESEESRPRKWRVFKNRVIIEGSAQDGRQLKLSGVLLAVVVGGVRGF
ncbi:hypothetical protein, partial [Variovorax sp. WS11]|uniref:hypothetical protein n=1 Tax=Variovorax sp. WS11 TaxID=1105204 RepID=UPI001C63A6C3